MAASNCDAAATCDPPIGAGDGRISQLWTGSAAGSGGDKVTIQHGSSAYLVVPGATGGSLVDSDGRYVVYDGGSPYKQYIGSPDAPNNARVLYSRPVSAAALSGSTLWTAGTTAGCLSQTDLTTRKTVQTVATGAPCVPSELQAAAGRWVYWSCGSSGPAGVWGGAGKRALWSTRTSGNSGAHAVMQNDGNLVVYRRTSGTGRRPTVNRSHEVGLEQLTSREFDVFKLLVCGYHNEEIAKILVVAESTVKSYVQRLYDKLGVRDRVQVVVYAYEHGLIVMGQSGWQQVESACWPGRV